MVGLTLQSDVSALEVAIAALVEQLNEQAAALSSDDNLFRSRIERSRKDRERNRKVYSRDSSPVDRPWFERTIRKVGLRSRRQHRHRSRSILAEESISLFGGFSTPPSDEQKRAIVDRLIACVAAAGAVAGFDVGGAEA
jgi:stalled ribosome alternative rescue factor ArfA